MKVELMNSIDSIKKMEYNAAYAMLTCHANTDNLQSEKPEVFIKRAIKMGHESILEHITLTFEVKWLSRACLQELARHRHISLSVESTRHTLKKKAIEYWKNDKFVDYMIDNFPNTEHDVMLGIFEALFAAAQTRSELTEERNKYFKSNDYWKYCIPEFFPTNLIMTSNIRELRHILKLRTTPNALGEFQELANEIFKAVPDEFKYMLEDCIYKKEEQND